MRLSYLLMVALLVPVIGIVLNPPASAQTRRPDPRADINRDQRVNLQDYLIFFDTLANQNPTGDINQDTSVNSLDYIILFESFGQELTSPTPNPTTAPAPLLGDVNRDGHVNLTDYVLLYEAYGTKTGDTRYNERADFVGGPNASPNGTVNVLDYTALFENFGR